MLLPARQTTSLEDAQLNFEYLQSEQNTAARAYRNGALTLTASTFTKIPVDTLSFDLSGVSMDVVTNHRYNVQQNGVYQVNAQCSVNPSTTNSTNLIALGKNGTIVVDGGRIVNTVANILSLAVNDLVQCVQNDYLELFFFTTSAFPLSAGVATDNYLSVVRVA